MFIHSGHYGPDGRVVVRIVSDAQLTPSQPAVEQTTDWARLGLPTTMTACCGTYAFGGETVRRRVDMSWRERWTGAGLTRDGAFDAGTVLLTTRPTPNSRDGQVSSMTAVWENGR